MHANLIFVKDQGINMDLIFLQQMIFLKIQMLFY